MTTQPFDMTQPQTNLHPAVLGKIAHGMAEHILSDMTLTDKLNYLGSSPLTRAKFIQSYGVQPAWTAIMNNVLVKFIQLETV